MIYDTQVFLTFATLPLGVHLSFMSLRCPSCCLVKNLFWKTHW